VTSLFQNRSQYSGIIKTLILTLKLLKMFIRILSSFLKNYIRVFFLQKIPEFLTRKYLITIIRIIEHEMTPFCPISHRTLTNMGTRSNNDSIILFKDERPHIMKKSKTFRSTRLYKNKVAINFCFMP
jgi:hypothetical protein